MTGFSTPWGARSIRWERHQHKVLGAGMQTLQEFGYCKQIRVTGRPSVHHFRQEVLDFSDDMRQFYN